MSGKTDTFSADILKLIFWGTAIANLADNAASSPNTQLYLSLHTADPTDTPASGQATSECNYTGYGRVAVNRNNTAWGISGKVLTTLADIIFGKCTGGSNTALYAGIGTSATGAGKLLYSGVLGTSIAITNGVKPVIEAGSTITEE